MKTVFFSDSRRSGRRSITSFIAISQGLRRSTRPGVNFTNILRAAFLCDSVLARFLYLQFGFLIFCQKNIGAKAAHKMLVKLTSVSKHPGRSRCHQTTGAETSSPIAQSPDGFMFEL